MGGNIKGTKDTKDNNKPGLPIKDGVVVENLPAHLSVDDIPPLSRMSRRLIHIDGDYSPPRRKLNPQGDNRLHFFYGTLMDPATLAKVLNRDELPVLVPAKILGYHCKLWGDYPAVVDGATNEPVYGMAYRVESQEDIERLEVYETDHYKSAGCIIWFEDGTEESGILFKWKGDEEDLRKGNFDLKDWKMDRLERELGNT